MKPNGITFEGTVEDGEMLRIAESGFYVRGIRVPQDADEALAVFVAFTAWLKTTRVEGKT